MSEQTAVDDLLAKEYISLTDHLALLSELGSEFAMTLDLNATLAKAVERITKHIAAAGGALFLLDEAGETLRCEACWGATEITGLVIQADQGIVGRCVQNKVGEIVRDVSTDPSFNASVDAETGFTTRSILCAPMTVQDNKLGAIELVNKLSDDELFAQSDLQLLQVLASSAALSILNARMAAQLVEQERIRRELELAAEIQRSLLPARREADFPVHGVNVPARTVSGDFFDFFELEDGRVMFNLGDVSGKGMNAALMMAKTASLFRCLGKTIHNPGELLARINDEICETSTRGMFVTMVGGLYDPKTGTLRIANAGHEPPLLMKTDGSFEEIPADAPPLGLPPILLDEAGFPERDVDLNGGALFIFTDGVTEGRTANGTPLEATGVRSILIDGRDEPATQKIGAVVDCLTADGGPLKDDITLMVIDDAPRLAGAHGPRSVQLYAETLEARPDQLKVVRNAVFETGETTGLGGDTLHDVVIAIDEACQNIIRHAYKNEGGAMDVEIRREEERFVVLLRDYAPTVDIEKIKPRDLDDIRPGGLGTHFINEIMDEVTYIPPPGGIGNLLRLTKQIE